MCVESRVILDGSRQKSKVISLGEKIFLRDCLCVIKHTCRHITLPGRSVMHDVFVCIKQEMDMKTDSLKNWIVMKDTVLDFGVFFLKIILLYLKMCYINL